MKVATTPEVVELREGHKYVESSTCARQFDGPAEVETDDDEDEKDEDGLVELADVDVCRLIVANSAATTELTMIRVARPNAALFEIAGEGTQLCHITVSPPYTACDSRCRAAKFLAAGL